MGCLPLIALVVFALVVTLISSKTGFDVETILGFGAIVVVMLVALGYWAIRNEEREKADMEKVDRSAEAGAIARSVADRTDMSYEEKEKHYLQGREM
jgi:hypothetical protein